LNKTIDPNAADKEFVKVFKDRAFGSLNRLAKLSEKFQSMRRNSLEVLP
jgi:hypothetical protein